MDAGEQPPRIAVSMDIVLRADDRDEAERALEDARAALASLATTGPGARTYEDFARSFIEQGSENTLAAGQVPLSAKLHVELPAAAIERHTNPTPVSSLTRYVRSIAADDRVQLPVSISARKPGDDGAVSLDIQPRQGVTDGAVDRARIANFLHLLEKQSRTITITSVECSEPEDGGFARFRTQVSVANAQ